MNQMPVSELMGIVQQAGVLQKMSSEKLRRVTVDYSPARSSLAVARQPDEEEPLVPLLPEVITLTFTLEDAMFGGSVFVALTCAERVIINPFLWISYEHLAGLRVSPV